MLKQILVQEKPLNLELAGLRNKSVNIKKPRQGIKLKILCDITNDASKK